jgi:SAM-dependent methyltransferase
MARIFSKQQDVKPKINRQEVINFFKDRSHKSNTLGKVQAVIYQDKNPDLAHSRNKKEKEVLLPLLELDQHTHVLDVGCGTGRWIPELINYDISYLGIDISDELIQLAAEDWGDRPNISFQTTSVDEMDTASYQGHFDLILSFGVLIYLNDDELDESLKNLCSMLSNTSTLLIREPVAVERRLSIVDHYSQDMDQNYNAIYRTEYDLLEKFNTFLFSNGFELHSSDYLYKESTLNNRKETVQKWFKIVRVQS